MKVRVWAGLGDEAGRGTTVGTPAGGAGCYRPTSSAICDVLAAGQRPRR